MKKVLVEMTVEQARAATLALDLFSRVCMGQMNIVAELFRWQGVQASEPGSETGGRPLTMGELKRMDELCNAAKGILGFGPGASFGIGSRAVSVDAHRTYEVLCVVKQALAKDEAPFGNSVWHDGLRLRYTRDPAPSAQVKEEADEKA